MQSGAMAMLSRKVKFAYASPAFAFGTVGALVALYFPRLYADEIGIPLGQVGAVSTAVGIVDALTNPAVGLLTDQWTSSWGRRRPLMLGSSFCLAAGFVALFSPPQDLDKSLMLVYVAPIAVTLTIFWTSARVPYLSWGIELTSEYDEKNTVVHAREFMWTTGVIFGTSLPSLFGTFVDHAIRRLTFAAGACACLVIVATLFCFFAVPDQHDPAPRVFESKSQRSSVSSTTTTSTTASVFLRRLVSNRIAMVLYVAVVLFNMGVTSAALLISFFVSYVLEEDEDALVWMLACFILTSALFVPAATLLAKRFDKRLVLAGAMLVHGLGFLLIFSIVGRGMTNVFLIIVMCIGMSVGGSSLKYSLLSDVADVEQLRAGGLRDEGKLIGLFEISSKIASTFLVSVAFWMIDVSGYQAGVVPQTEDVILTIRICYALVPGLLALVASAIIFFMYPLTRSHHAEVVQRLSVLSISDENCTRSEPSSSDTEMALDTSVVEVTPQGGSGVEEKQGSSDSKDGLDANAEGNESTPSTLPPPDVCGSVNN